MKMIKYVDTLIGFSEVPDEISLCINISNCPCYCSKCHSSYLAKDIGEPLTPKKLDELINSSQGITCVCFMGGDKSPGKINLLAKYVKSKFKLKTTWYSGRQEISKSIDIKNFNYIKIGPYIEELGPLNSKTTNQRFYKVESNKLIDITNKFFKHEIKN